MVKKKYFCSSATAWVENRRIQYKINPKLVKGCAIGSTAMMDFDDSILNISDQGCDARNLGPWSYIYLTGKIKLCTSVLAHHCPIEGSSPAQFTHST